MKIKVTTSVFGGKIGEPIKAYEYPLATEGEINIKGATSNKVVFSVDELHENSISFHIVSGKEKIREPQEGSLKLVSGGTYVFKLSNEGRLYNYTIALSGTVSKEGVEFARLLKKKDPDTIYKLGLLTIEGTEKVLGNPEKGLELIEEAASLGSADAKDYLETEYFDDNAETQGNS